MAKPSKYATHVIPENGLYLTIAKKRQKIWVTPKPKYTRGDLAKYAKLVTSASEGAVTDKWT